MAGEDGNTLYREARRAAFETLKTKLAEAGFGVTDSGGWLLVEFPDSDREIIVGFPATHPATRYWKNTTGFSDLKGATGPDHEEFRRRNAARARGQQ